MVRLAAGFVQAQQLGSKGWLGFSMVGKIGLYRDNGKENGNYRDYRDYVGYILGVILGCIGIMEKKMETTGTIGIM